MKFLKINKFRGFAEKLSPRERIIFYMATFFVFLTLMDRLIINPISSKMNTLNAEISEKKIALQKNLRILAQKERIEKEVEQYSQILNNVKSEEDITPTLGKIENLASKTGVYIVDMKPIDLKNVGAIKKHLIKLSCEAPMEQLVEFIAKIESLNNLLIIERCQMAPKSRESDVVKSEVSIVKIIIP